MVRALATKILDKQDLNYAAMHGINITDISFTKQLPLPFETSLKILQQYDALIFTSSNAVKFFLTALSFSIPLNFLIFSINEKTEKALIKKGFTNIISSMNSNALALEIIKYRKQKLLHLCGKQKLNILKDILQERNIIYHFLDVYKTTHVLQNIDLKPFIYILFFSPSGIKCFFQNHNLMSHHVLCCIGTSTANSAKAMGIDNAILIANRPSIVEMTNTITKFLNSKYAL